MDAKDKILAFIRMRGPSLPTAVAKHIEQESYFVSAHLSEMKEQGKVRISNIKVGGGSPLYYLPGQEGMLQNFSENLGEKERKVYNLLKAKKVLRDFSLVPVFRAAIRTIKDFAFPFSVSFKGQKELFWKWYLLSNEEAEGMLKGLLGVKDEKKAEEEKPEAIKEEQKKLEKALADEQKKPAISEKKETNLYNEVNSYFKKNNIRTIEENIIRKSSEMDFIVEVPSPVGNLRYYVKAKSKKRINDGDLSSVFIQAQNKRLPVLFLGRGELTKKAQEMLETEFKGMRYNKI